jgi:GINS complex subunit 1
MVEQNLDIETTKNEDHYGAVILHLSLLRNKRCLMAYMYCFSFKSDCKCFKMFLCDTIPENIVSNQVQRPEVIQSFRWKVGPVIPHDI